MAASSLRIRRFCAVWSMEMASNILLLGALPFIKDPRIHFG